MKAGRLCIHRTGLLIALGTHLAFAQPFAAQTAAAPGGIDDNALARLEQSYQAALAKVDQPIAQLNVSYTQALQRLFDSEAAAGRLDSSLLVQAEQKAFGDGSGFDAAEFEKRTGEDRALEAIRRTYIGERSRLQGLSRDQRSALAKTYIGALQRLEQKHTVDKNLPLALNVRAKREAVEAAQGDKGAATAFEGRIHFIAKGDLEFRLNGEKISFRDEAKEIDGDGNEVEYREGMSLTGGSTRPRKFSVGDVLLVKMRSRAVFRTMIMAIESADGKIVAPVSLNDFRQLGVADGEKLSKEQILQVVDNPAVGGGDPNMTIFWKDLKMSEKSRARSQWIKIGPGSEWQSYAVVIREDMLLPAE